MLDTIIQATPHMVPWVAIVVSVITGFFGVRGYFLSKKIQSELKSDEVLISGVLHNPSLSHPDHENCVIQTTLFNKSKRKVYISKVEVFDAKGEVIEVDWSDRIDQYGNTQGGSKMIGVIDSSALCIRRNDGKAFRTARVEISHSFDTQPLTLTFEIEAGWQEYFAK